MHYIHYAIIGPVIVRTIGEDAIAVQPDRDKWPAQPGILPGNLKPNGWLQTYHRDVNEYRAILEGIQHVDEYLANRDLYSIDEALERQQRWNDQNWLQCPVLNRGSISRVAAGWIPDIGRSIGNTQMLRRPDHAPVWGTPCPQTFHRPSPDYVNYHYPFPGELTRFRNRELDDTKETRRDSYDRILSTFQKWGLPTDELEYPEHAYGPW